MSSKSRTSGRNKSRTAHKGKRTPVFHPTALARTPAQAAQECEKLADQYPDDRAELLQEAAGEWNAAGEHDRALALYERLLDPHGPDSRGVREPDLVDAFRIDVLWDAGREEEARAAATAFRKRHPRDAGAWNFVAEAFEARDERATASEYFTAGVTHALGAGVPVTVDTVEADPYHYDIEMLVIGRHRVRRQLGEPHDDWDEVADALHERRAAPFMGHATPLDEMHDPLRLLRLAKGAPDVLESEIRALPDMLRGGSLPTGAASRSTCVLYWPPEEFTGLLERWPKAADAYGSDHAYHRRQVERMLRKLSEEGARPLAVGRATVRGLEAQAEENGGSPDALGVRSAYADHLARRGQVVGWPPPRNGPCWCGSERKYKKCCGNPALA